MGIQSVSFLFRIYKRTYLLTSTLYCYVAIIQMNMKVYTYQTAGLYKVLIEKPESANLMALWNL